MFSLGGFSDLGGFGDGCTKQCSMQQLTGGLCSLKHLVCFLSEKRQSLCGDLFASFLFNALKIR